MVHAKSCSKTKKELSGLVYRAAVCFGFPPIPPPHAHRELSVVANIPAITAITQDALDAIWVSSAQSGLYCLEKEYDRYEQVAVYDKYTSGLNTSNIQSVCADDFAKVWIGANDGRLLAYDCKGGRFEDFSRMCGMTGEGVQNLLMDKNGCLWISTNRKITCFDILKETSVNYVVGDNLVMTSFVSGSYCLGHGGEVYFGGNRGFSAFGQAERYMGDFHKPLKVFVTDIKVHNQSVFDPNSSSVYDAAAKRLQIAPGDNNVEIEFSTLYYDSPSKLQYAYKLEGVDNEWHYTGTGRRYANYGNLEAGQYRFLMMATDVNGRWSDNIAELEIIKSPSWYKTTWFKTLCLLLLVLLLFGINRIWMNRLRLREELKIARINREKSEELTQTKLRYFTNISHELLTPLTILSCLIDDMENTRTKSKNQLEMMRFNLSRLKRLLQQILDFRKVENDAMKLSVMETDLVSFVHRIGSYNFMPLAKEKNISFDISLPDAPVVGWFDMEKMDIILFNLLSNAFKYTMANGRVRLDLKVFEQHGKRVAKISVSDTGMGIAPEHIEHIFTRFYSVDPSHSLESHGIGLTLTKELTDLHHGSITVESRQGIGSDFVVEFPLDKEAYSDAERSEIRDERGLVATRNPLEDMAENDKALESLAPQEDIHLLLVEDNEQLRTVVNRILQRTYHTYTAGNGKEALEIIRNNPIDILVSDIIMPEMNGLELCREVKDHVETSHIGVLLLTAKNAVTDWVDAYNVGADGYLSKPFELSVLMAKINSMVKNRKGKIEQFRDNTEINISSLDYASIEERFLENAIAVIESHLAEMDFDLESFSSGMNMSKSSLYRKIKSLTGLSPVEFTKNIRLKHACKMLGKRTGNVSEIAYSVGFSDPKYFTYCFKAQFKMTPTEYIRKYAEN